MGGLALLLRAEWLVIFLVGVYQYVAMHGNPYWLLPLLLAPDLSMVGYLAGPRVGALTYNAVHNLAVALVLLAVGWLASLAPVGLLGAIVFAHVGMDRALGSGLKLPTDFRDTHLGRIGRRPARPVGLGGHRLRDGGDALPVGIAGASGGADRESGSSARTDRTDDRPVAGRARIWFHVRVAIDPPPVASSPALAAPPQPPPGVRQLISLGGSGGRESVDRGPERRVVLAGMVGAAGFVAAGAIVFLTGLGGGGWWLPLHLALAGGAGLAIAALLPHFTVSLAGARPAPARIRFAGLGLTAGGALSVALAFPSSASLVAILGASAYLAGIAVSASTAFIPARAGVGRRFGIVEAAYALALGNAALAVGLAMLRLGDVATVDGAWLGLKPAHAWLNLVGFLSLVVAATLIHLYPTVVGSRIRSRPALLGVVAGVGIGAPITALGYAVESAPLARLGAIAVVAGAGALAVVAAGAWPGRGRWTTDPDWHRLTIGHLSAAVAWFGIGAVILAAGVLSEGARPAGWSLQRAVGPIVIGWALQALVGAWSHLVPSVGPGDAGRHSAQRRELAHWATLRLVAWNLGAGLVTAGAFGPAWLSIGGLAMVGTTLLASLALLARALVVRGGVNG